MARINLNQSTGLWNKDIKIENDFENNYILQTCVDQLTTFRHNNNISSSVVWNVIYVFDYL